MPLSDEDLMLLWAIDNWRKLDSAEQEFYAGKYANEMLLTHEVVGAIDTESSKTIVRPEIVFAKLMELSEKRAEMKKAAEKRAEAAAIAEKAEKAEKASKKKLKKEKQKEKRNGAKEKTEETQSTKTGTKKKEHKEKVALPENDVAVEDKRKKQQVVRENEESSDSVDDDNGDKSGDDSEIDIANAYSFAFIKSSIKGDSKKINKKSTTANKAKEPVNATHVAQDRMYQTDGDHFPNLMQKNTKTSEEIGIQALKIIKLGDFRMAIDLLNKAINLDFNDTRHYINRSYCHLRLGHYKEALEDIEFASKHFTDAAEIGKAKCRKGQALKGLNEFEAAEQAFRECLELIPNCPSAKRELKRVQITQIVNSGFKECDAIITLEEEPSTAEAIILLSGKPISDNESDVPDSVSDDEIYYSDDETASNETILSIFLEYDPDSLVAEQNVAPRINRQTNHFTQPQGDRELKVIKTVKPAVPLNNQLNNDMAVWFGDTNNNLSDAMFKKAFAKYGKILSIHRGPKGYGFVNFAYPGCAKKTLDEANANGGYIDINGVLIQVKRKK